MKVLLINPPQEYSDMYSEVIKDMTWVVPPLGLAYIAAYLEKHGIEVKIFDGQVQEKSKYDEMAKVVEETKPDVIGLNSTTPTFRRTVAAAKKVKEIFPDVLIVVGGPHVTALPVKSLRENPEFDVVAYGEGELTMLDIITHVKEKRGFGDILGIAFRKNGDIIKNPPRPLIRNLDEIPFPARHLLPDIRKYQYVNYKRLPSAHMITSRGCPFRCIFCDHPFGRGHRAHSIDYVIKEIKHVIKEYGIRDIQFHDENIMVNKKRLEEFCSRLIAEKIDVTWSCLARAENADFELFRKMKKAGCWLVSFGVESGNQKVLDFIQKDLTLDTIREAVKKAKKAGLVVRGSFMIGHPIDTRETIQQTIDFAKSLKLDHCSFAITVPYPGSELYEIAEQYGDFKKDDFKLFKRQDEEHVAFVPNGLTEKELIDFLKKARFETHFNLSYILRTAARVRDFDTLKRYLRSAYGIFATDVLRLNKSRD